MKAKNSKNSPLFDWMTKGILAVIGAGIVLVFQSVATSSINEKITNHEVRISKNESTNKDIKKKIDDIYWYLIDRNGVKPPSDSE